MVAKVDANTNLRGGCAVAKAKEMHPFAEIVWTLFIVIVCCDYVSCNACGVCVRYGRTAGETAAESGP